MEWFCTAETSQGLSGQEIRTLLLQALEGRILRRVLILPPDFTRYHSYAGQITSFCYRELTRRGCRVDVMPALGTHAPVTREEAEKMFPGIPYETLLVHRWREDVVALGEIPGAYLKEITEGCWEEPVRVEINRRVVSGEYDLILSVGQVVPHEVAGMANHAKNLFVGVGGSEMIQKSHMIGALYGLERIMGRDHTPVRALFDYALQYFLSGVPVLFAETVCTADRTGVHVHGLFIGDTRKTLERAAALAREKNLNVLERGLKKCVVYLEPGEYKSTWLGNKAVYRTRLAMEDQGELLILAPGVQRFGEDEAVDRLIRKYGYRGREEILRQFRRPENRDLRENMGAAAHLIHGSSDGRFQIVYAVSAISRAEIAAVGFQAADYAEMAARYDPSALRPGWTTMPDGEEIYFIANPALGLWARREVSGVLQP